jgi:hypothetical protein
VGYGYPNSTVSGIVAPLVFTFLLAYFVSGMFSEVFSMGIETVLCCYIADEEMFPLEQRFADGSLKSALQEAAKTAAKNQVTPVQVHIIQDNKIVIKMQHTTIYEITLSIFVV